MKKFTVISILVLCSILGINAQSIILPYYQDFASLSSGNMNDENGSSDAVAVADLSSFLTTVTNGYKAGGVLRLGTDAAVGSITTQPVDAGVNARIKVAFRALSWSNLQGSTATLKPTKIMIQYGSQSQVIDIAPAPHNFPLDPNAMGLYSAYFDAEPVPTAMTISTVASADCDNRVFFDNFKVAGTLIGEPLYEGFEDALFPPAGWTSVHSSGTKYWERGTSGVIGAGAARHAYSNPGSTNLLVTPKLKPAYGQNLTYKVITTNSSTAGTKLYIVLSTTTTEEAAFTEVLDSVPVIPTSWADKTVDLSGYVDQSIYIAFKAVDKYGCNLLIDEINGPNIDISDQTCPKPASLAMTQVEHNIATLTWQDNGAERWVVEHSLNADFSAATTQTVTSATATISNLTPTTRYYVRVKADCYDGEYSAFAKTDFTTPCAPITESVWVESFANYSTTTMLPNCWTRSLSYGNSTTASYVYPNVSTSANAKYDAVGGGLYFSHSVYVSPNTYTLIATPKFDYALQDKELAFYHKLNTTRINPLFELVVGVMSNPNDPSTFVAIESISDTTRTWVGRYINLETAPADYQYIAFKFQDLGDGSYQNSGVTMYIDNLELHLRPNCDMVTDLDVVFGNEPRAVDVTFQPGGIETEWVIDYKLKGTTEWTSMQVTSNNVTIRGLRDKKQYDIRVRAVCATDEVSNWLYGEFSTECSYIPAVWSENFNTSDTSNISTPLCWNIYEGAYTYDGITYPYANQGVIDGDTAYMHFRVSSSTQKQSIATPTFSEPINGSQVEFKLKRSAMLIDSRFTVGAWVEGDSSTYVELLDVTPENTSWNNFTILLHSLTPLHNQIIFTAKNPATSGYSIPIYYLDNVTVNPIGACPKPYSLKVDSLATNAAKISWTKAYQETEWHVDYKLSSDSEWTALAPNPTTTPTALITGLQPGTSYDIRVQAVCGVDANSDFISLSLFTECISTDELSENFDAVATGYLPNCWKGYSKTPAIAFPKVEDALASNGVPTKAVKMIGSSPLFLISQKMSGDISNYMVTFKLNKQSSSSAAIQIGYMTDPTDTTTFVSVGTYDNGTNYKNYVTHYATFPANSGTDLHVAFRHGAVAGYSYSDYSSNYIDDVVIDTVPTCIPLRGIALSNTDAYSTTLTITANDASQSNWEYAYTTDLTATPADSLVRGTTTQTTTTVANLTPNTSYKFWARAVCGTDRSTWSNAQITKTDCAASLNVGFTENFDNIAIDQLPDCWQRISTTSSPNVVAADTGNGVSSKAVKFQDSKPQFLVLPEASVPLAALEVKFKLNKEGSTNKMQIGYLSDPTDQNTFVAVADLENTVNKTMVQYSISFENVVDNGSNRYIAFRYGDVGSVTQSTYWYYWLDDIEIIASPVCSAVTNARPLEIGLDSVKVTFDAPQGQTAWEYVITSDLTVTTPDESQAQAITSNTFVVNNLQASTSYKLWVRAVCDPTTKSAWSDAAQFRTACGKISIPWTESFTLVDAADRNNALCWTRVVEAATTPTRAYPYVDMTSTGQSGTRGLYDFYSSNATPEVMAATPEFDTPLSGAELKFWLKYDTSYPDPQAMFEVGYMSDPTDMTTYHQLQVVTPTVRKQWVEVNVLLNAVPDTARYLAFRSQQIAESLHIYVDEISVHPAPTCPRPTGLVVDSVGTTGESAKLSWAQGNATNWMLYYKKSTDQNWDSVAVATTPTATLSSLDELTTYEVKVKAACSTTDHSLFSESVTFTTPCHSVTLPFEENFEAAPSVPCWTKAKGLASTLFDQQRFNQTDNSTWAHTTSTNGIASPHMKVNVWGILKYDWLITPTLVIPQGENLGASLHFTLALTAENSAAAASNYGDDDKFIVAIATDNGTNWVDSIVWSNDSVNYHDYDFNTISTTAERIRINLTQYAGQNIRIGFYVESTVSNASNDLHLDSILVKVDTIAPPTIVTQPATQITHNSAQLNGVVTQGTYNIESEGFYYRVQTVGQWNYSQNGVLAGLNPGTTYEFYLSATANGVIYRGDTLTFTTEGQPAIHPVVTTVAADNITQTTATLHRTLTEDPSEPVTQKGWKYKKTSDADNAWLNTSDGSLSNLMANTEYQFFAYATTDLGTYNGETLTFQTLAHVAPTVVTQQATDITCTSATLNKQVTAGSEIILSQGWKFRRANDAGSPWFDADASGAVANLSPETEYMFFAYATTSTFPMLTGDTLRFTTPECPPVGLELAESTITIYPNPAKDEVNILVDGLTTDATATIFDMQGRAVGKYTVAATTGKATVDVSTLADGTYVVRIVSKDINRVERLIIKR